MDLAATHEIVPVHDWQKEELDRRKESLMRNPGSGLSWEEVKRRVRGRYRPGPAARDTGTRATR
jgi:putative addiction module component (TIGR02574 family)